MSSGFHFPDKQANIIFSFLFWIKSIKLRKIQMFMQNYLSKLKSRIFFKNIWFQSIDSQEVFL